MAKAITKFLKIPMDQWFDNAMILVDDIMGDDSEIWITDPVYGPKQKRPGVYIERDSNGFPVYYIATPTSAIGGWYQKR